MTRFVHGIDRQSHTITCLSWASADGHTEMLDVNTPTKAAVLLLVMAVTFGLAAGFAV